MLKAIVTVLDEDNKVLSANMLIEEYNSTPVAFGIDHEFRFRFTTADMDLINRFNKSCEGFTLRADEIREAWEGGTDIDEGG